MRPSADQGQAPPGGARSRRPASLLFISAAASVATVAAPAGVAFLMGWASWPAVAGWTCAFVVCLGVVAGLESFASGSAGPAAHLDRGANTMTLSLASLTGLVVFAMAAVSLRGSGPVPAPLMILAGVSFMAAGGLLRFCAVRRLGVRFTSDNGIAAGAALEQDGVYRWLAHPSEVGLMFLGLGGLCLEGSNWFGGLLCALAGLQIWRIHLEERALFRHYKDVYLRYRRRTLDPLPSILLIAGGRE